MVPTKENAEEFAASPAQAIPVTPPKAKEEKVYDAKEIIETAKRTRRDSFEKMKQIETARKSKISNSKMGAGLINKDSDSEGEDVSEAKKRAQNSSTKYVNQQKEKEKTTARSHKETQ